MKLDSILNGDTKTSHEGGVVHAEERLADAFERIDSEGKGYISKENLKCILGPDYNSKMVDKMIKEVSNGKHDGKINYQDFLRVMAQENDTDSNSFFRRR